jgi:hypothetical protein
VILVVGFGLLVISVIVRGGDVAAITRLRLRWAPAVVSAIVIQILIISVVPRALPAGVAAGLHLLSYALAAAFLVVNRRVPGLWLVGLGGLCNLVAVSANGGVMPASRAALATAGIQVAKGRFSNSASLAHPHLYFLGDVFAVPHGVPLANVFSVGDVVLLAGAGILLHRVCRSASIRSGAGPAPVSPVPQ